MRRSDGSARRAPFGENLRGALRKRKLTNKAFAAKIGVTEFTVSRWIHGKSEPDIEAVVRAADALDMTLQDWSSASRTRWTRRRGTRSGRWRPP